jgi:hypothetical protein
MRVKNLRWLNTVFKRWKIHDLDAYFWTIIFDKEKVPYLYKTTSKEFEFLRKSCANAVAVATMTFQDSGYLRRKWLIKSLKNELWNFVVDAHAHYTHPIVDRSINVSLLTGCLLAKAYSEYDVLWTGT